MLGGVCALAAAPALAQMVVHNAPGQPVAILFPDLPQPFRKIFLDIIAGIESRARQRVRAYPLAPGQDLQELSAALKRNQTRLVVALGRQGLKAAAAIDAPLGMVVSGVSSVPDAEKQHGVCLTPDPALLFAQLKSLLPATRRVLVVYNPQHNEWLMGVARGAARAAGLELGTLEARDLAGAARLYESAFASADGRRDAVWLPTDPTTVDETTIIPIVLRDSWNRRVPIFSSSLLHINKGALFSLYPNNVELGRSLADLANDLLAGIHPPPGVTPLRQVHAALNTRTASHFGISITPRMQQAFDYVYPAP